MRRDVDRAMTLVSWSNPYAWPRKPLLAQNVVATSQPLAAQAGLQDARRRRQRGGRNPRDRDHADPGRAGVERHRFRCLCDRLGRTQAPWPERLGALASRGGQPTTSAARRSCPSAVGIRSLSRAPCRRGSNCTASSANCRFVNYSNRRSATAARGSSSRRPSRGSGQAQVDKLKDLPGFAQAFLPGGRAPRAGERFHFQETCIGP